MIRKIMMIMTKRHKSKIKREYKVAMILAFFLAFATLSSLASATSKGIASSSLTYDISNPITLADGAVIAYTPVCSEVCWLPINITYSGTLETATKSLRNSDVTYSKILLVGDDPVRSIDYYYLSYETGTVSVKTLDRTCLKTLGNGTVQRVCEKYVYANTTTTGYFLRPLTITTMTKGIPNVIVLRGTMSSSVRASSVDIVPTILGFAMPELALWNVSSLVLSLPFNENTGTFVRDYSPWGNNLTAPSAIGWTAGRYDYGYDFQSYSNGTIGASSSLETGGTATWSAWIKTTQTGAGLWYDVGASGCSNDGFQMGIGVTGAGLFNAHFGGRSWLGGSTPVNTGGWMFVAVTYDTTNFKFYVNDSATTIALIATNATSTANNWGDHTVYVGSCGSANIYIGLLDEFQVWNTTLSKADLEVVMNSAIFVAEDSESPQYLSNGTNNTNPNPLEQVFFYSNWTDNVGLSGHIFSWNATGATCSDGMANDSFVEMTGLANWSNVTKQMPLACAGKTIDWLIYANDTSDNWNKTVDMFENEGLIPTLLNLYLNGAESNITLGNTTALNITAYANISLPADLYINDTLIQSGELIENVSYYPEGLYNITVEWVGNGSYSESNATWWANITYTPAPPTNYSSPYNVNTSWNWCISNNTLLNHMAIFNNGTFSQSNDTYTICEYGCENNICNDEPMISGLKIFGFIIILFLIFMFLDKKVLK